MNLPWTRNMPWLTRLRVASVRGFARLCHVPIIIDVCHMREFQIAEVADYIDDCEKLFGPIFDPEKLQEFRVWAWDFLAHPRVLDNPFNLHVPPIETVAVFFHINPQSQAMDTLYKKYQASPLADHDC